MPDFSYHLQIFCVDDTTETANVKKYCLCTFEFFFLFSLFPFHFPLNCSQAAVLGQRIGGCNSACYYELAKTMTCWFFKKVKRDTYGFEM